MKKIILMSSVVMFSIGMMNAQATQTSPTKATAAPVRTAEARAKDKVAQISKDGSLQADQLAKINNLFTDFYKRQDALKAIQGKLDAKEYEKQMSEMKIEHNTALKAVLTAEQVKNYEAAELKKQERMNNATKSGN